MWRHKTFGYNYLQSLRWYIMWYVYNTIETCQDYQRRWITKLIITSSKLIGICSSKCHYGFHTSSPIKAYLRTTFSLFVHPFLIIGNRYCHCFWVQGTQFKSSFLLIIYGVQTSLCVPRLFHWVPAMSYLPTTQIWADTGNSTHQILSR